MNKGIPRGVSAACIAFCLILGVGAYVAHGEEPQNRLCRFATSPSGKIVGLECRRPFGRFRSDEQPPWRIRQALPDTAPPPISFPQFAEPPTRHH